MKRILVLALCTLPFAAHAQQDDRDWLTALLEDNLSDAGRKVTITGFAGALSSPATIEKLTIADDTGIWLTLDKVVLDWSRSALLTGRLSVDRLTAAEIVLDRLPATSADTSLPAPEATAFALPDLPVSVEIGTLGADHIVLGPTVLGQPVEATLNASASLAGGEGKATLTLRRTDDGPAGDVSLTASYANETSVLALDLAVEEAAGGIASSLIGLPGNPAIELTVKGEGPLSDYAADIRLASGGSERLAGKVTLAEAADGGMRFTADLGGDPAPMFLPEYAEFFGDDVKLAAQGTKAADGWLTVDDLTLRTQALDLRGNLALAADGLPERFALRGSLGQDGTPVLLPLSTDIPTSITHADIALGFDASEAEAWTADIAMTGFDRADLKLREAKIAGKGLITREEGKPAVSGDFDITADGIEPTDPALAQALGAGVKGSVGFRWREGYDALQLTKLALNGADYSFDGTVNIAGLEEALSLTGQGNLRADDLSRFAALAGQPVGGRAEMTLGGSYALLGGKFDVTGQINGTALRTGITEADNLLAGSSTIDLSVIRDETGLRVRQLDLAAASLRAKISGQLATSGSDLSADLDFTDLSALGGPYGGGLTGRARFTGTPEAGTVTFDGTGKALKIGVPEADSLLKGDSAISAEAGIAGETVDLRKLDIKAASLAASARGTLAKTGSDVSAELDFSDLRALGGAYRGALSATASFSGTPEAGKLTAKATGRNLAIGQAEADRLLAGETRLAADLMLDGGRIKVNTATLDNPQLRVAADGNITDATRQVNLTADLVNLAILLPEFPGRLSVRGQIVDDGNSYRLDLTGQGPGGIDAKVQGTMSPDFRTANLTAVGAAQAALGNAFIDPRTVSGGIRYDLALRGPLQPASLSGRISLSDIRVSDPSLPTALTGFNGTISLSGGRAALDLSGSSTSGGNILIGGAIGLAAPYVTDLVVQLQQLIVKDPQLFTTRINGRVTMQGPLTGGAQIAGNIDLSETELVVPSTGLGAAGGLEGLRHVSEPADVHATRARAGLLDTAAGDGAGSGRPYPLDLRISAPQRLFIRGRGLDAELGGELRLQGTTANVVPSGSFNLVRGRLDILGKRLTLSEALLQLQGDFDPFISILASNDDGEIVSSVEIEGQATDPKITFVSQPELPQEEVLSHLLFGRDLTSLSAFQAAQLASAVATLAGKGGDGIIGKLRKGFGLDDLDVSTDAQGDTTLKAGKYISSKAYTEIEVDQNGQAKINLNLDLSKTVTLRGSVGGEGETSIGIFKEKDY